MFLTKKYIARRTFLRGAGVTLALPLLESMVPALTPARLTAAAGARRLARTSHPAGGPAGAAAARIDGAAPDARAPHGRGGRAPLRRHLAPARRLARLLEPAA